MWAWIGAAVAALGAFLGMRNARGPSSDPWAAGEYGMTPRSHARFAAVSAVFCVAFVAGAFLQRVPVLVLLAIYALLFVLYASSFARGSSEP
jgi:hypothetical protein